MEWIALFDVFHPDRTIAHFEPQRSSRFKKPLKLAIIEKASELRRGQRAALHSRSVS